MEAPEKIYLNPLFMEDGESIVRQCTFERQRDSQVEYTRTDAFIEKVKEAFCKATCNGNPPRTTCTSLGTCKEHDNFVKFMKGRISYDTRR